jgi:hypothetical protein
MNAKIVIRANPEIDSISSFLQAELNARGLLEKDSHSTAAVPLSLRVGKTIPLGPQGFQLDWMPSIDLAEIFDPEFTWHGDESSTLAETAAFTQRVPSGHITAEGSEGLLYGVLEFLERCDVRGSLPVRPIDLRRKALIPFRSSSLQLMKKGQYIIPIRRELFPWFFDRNVCLRYLNFLSRQRFNAITFWNFHPFPYFCPIEGHPEVAEISQDERDSNADHLRWLIKEAGLRGIRLFWHFYNIYVCPSFAKAHGLSALFNQFTPNQEKLVYKYIRDSVRSFANAFPEVGFVACAGEGVPAGKAERFVVDVLVSALNETTHHPPLIVRQWSSLSASRFSRDVVGKYDALWCMIKHNAEHIAGTAPEARVSDWVATGVPTVVNFHMISEIGPFRWGPPGYIREICLNYKALGVKGVNVFPHWQWRTPNVGDRNFNGDELDRDWLYHEAWGRYSFDPVRDRDEETRHWVRRAKTRGFAEDAARALITAYEMSGPSLPRLQQHLWAHYDNHSVLPAGLTLGQFRFGRSMHGGKIICTDRLEDILPLRAELQNWPSQSTGFRFDDAAAQSLLEINQSLAAVEPFVRRNDETERLSADLALMGQAVSYLRHKAKIADLLMKFSREDKLSYLDEAVTRLRESVAAYRVYRDHAEKWYEGISDVPPYLPFHNYKSIVLPYTWTDCLEVFDRELQNVEEFTAAMKASEPVSLAHHFGFDRVDPRRDLERQLIGAGGRWLKGDPDFLPWSKHLSKIEKLVLLPCAVYVTLEISVLSDLALVRSWVEKGGRLVLITLPDLPWHEAKVLAQVLGVDVAALDAKTTEHGQQRRLTIQAGNYLSWSDRSENRGIRGRATVGKGEVNFFALTSPLEWSQLVPN